MRRQEVLKQWENWKNQMVYQRSHGEPLDSQSQAGGKEKAYQELIGKIESELTHKPIHNTKHTQAEMRFEKTFAEEIKSNVCPICLELMIPPKNKPMILFPCGHTFCASCLILSEKSVSHRKCSLCKKVYSQKAINISLQNLICIFTDNQDLLEKLESNGEDEKEAEEHQNQSSSHYTQKLNLLQSRLTLLSSEQHESRNNIGSLKQTIKDSKKLLDILYEDLVASKDKLSQTQREIELTEQHIKSCNDKISASQSKLTESTEKLHLIEETIKGLEEERVKTVILMNGMLC